MVTAAIIGAKVSTSKIVGISAITAAASDFITSSITYHFWNGRNKITTVKVKNKKYGWMK